jgi:hypothetical protein
MSVSDDLDLIDRSIRQLQIEWDKFFSGVEKKPPQDLQGRVNALVRKYAYAEITNNSERFRYQSLTSRFTTYTELWNKRMRAREEGREAGVHLTHQQQLQARKMHEIYGPAPTVEELTAALGGLGPAPARPAPKKTGNQVRVADPGKDQAAIQTLYNQFMSARQASGEQGSVKMESFAKLIQQQTTKIRSGSQASAVEFRIEVKDGKPSLKAKPIK